MNLALAATAAAEARRCYHGTAVGLMSNLAPIAALFPTGPDWPLHRWDNCWCAAFVYFCCVRTGFGLPARYPDPLVRTSFAACIAWEQWARLPGVGRFRARADGAETGDIVLYDRVFSDGACDHMGVVVAASAGMLRVAEGNFNNVSAIVTRPEDGWTVAPAARWP